MIVELLLKKHEVGRVGFGRVASFKDNGLDYLRLVEEAVNTINQYDRVLWMRVNSAFSWFVNSNMTPLGRAKIVAGGNAFVFNMPEDFNFSKETVMEFSALLVAWSTVSCLYRRRKKCLFNRSGLKDPRLYRIASVYREEFIGKSIENQTWTAIKS